MCDFNAKVKRESSDAQAGREFGRLPVGARGARARVPAPRDLNFGDAYRAWFELLTMYLL